MKNILQSHTRDQEALRCNHTRGGQAYLAGVGHARYAPAPHNVKTSSKGALPRAAIRKMQDIADATGATGTTRTARRNARKAEYKRLEALVACTNSV